MLQPLSPSLSLLLLTVCVKLDCHLLLFRLCTCAFVWEQTGSVSISLDVLEETDTIILNVKELAVKNTSICTGDVRVISGEELSCWSLYLFLTDNCTPFSSEGLHASYNGRSR